MDRLDAMKVLLAVVDAGSLSDAARRLGTPLPTISRKMAELERHFGTRLLVRTSRRVAVTDAGTAYVAASRAILDRVEEAERLAAGEYTEARGQLAVTGPVVFAAAMSGRWRRRSWSGTRRSICAWCCTTGMSIWSKNIWISGSGSAISWTARWSPARSARSAG